MYLSKIIRKTSKKAFKSNSCHEGMKIDLEYMSKFESASEFYFNLDKDLDALEEKAIIELKPPYKSFKDYGWGDMIGQIGVQAIIRNYKIKCHESGDIDRIKRIFGKIVHNEDEKTIYFKGTKYNS